MLAPAPASSSDGDAMKQRRARVVFSPTPWDYFTTKHFHITSPVSPHILGQNLISENIVYGKEITHHKYNTITNRIQSLITRSTVKEIMTRVIQCNVCGRLPYRRWLSSLSRSRRRTGRSGDRLDSVTSGKRVPSSER